MGKGTKRFNKKNAKRLVLAEKPLKPYLNGRSSSGGPGSPNSRTSTPRFSHQPPSPPVLVDKRAEMTRLADDLDVEGFHDAWEKGSVDLQDLEYPDPAARGMTPFGVSLMKFDKGRRPEAIKFVAALITRGLDVRWPVDLYGSTCLHVLSRQHRDANTKQESAALKEFYYWLVAQGADQRARDKASKTPFDYSVDVYLRSLLEGYR